MTISNHPLIQNNPSIDTLKSQIKFLTHQIDSLNKVSAKTTVSTEYFHDILSGQVTTFVGIVTIIIALIGFISWQAIFKSLKTTTNQIRKELDKELKEHDAQIKALINNFKQEVEFINKKHERLNNKSLRASCAILLDAQLFERFLIYVFDVMISHLKLNELDKAEEFLDSMLTNEKELVKERLKEDLPKLKQKIIELKSYDNEGLNKILNDIEDQILTICYSENETGKLINNIKNLTK